MGREKLGDILIESNEKSIKIINIELYLLLQKDCFIKMIILHEILQVKTIQDIKS